MSNKFNNIKLKMTGLHQTENASIVIESCKLLRKYFNITNANIYNGLLNTFWPGRLEIMKEECMVRNLVWMKFLVRSLSN